MLRSPIEDQFFYTQISGFRVSEAEFFNMATRRRIRYIFNCDTLNEQKAKKLEMDTN